MSLKTGIIALGIGVGGYAVTQGVPSIQSDDGQDQTRNTMTGGIPQQAQGTPRGFGVPNTTNVTKKSVSVREGDTNITEVYNIENTGTKKESSESGSSSSDSTHIIRDEQSSGVIRDASPDDGSDTKKGHKNVVSV